MSEMVAPKKQFRIPSLYLEVRHCTGMRNWGATSTITRKTSVLAVAEGISDNKIFTFFLRPAHVLSLTFLRFISYAFDRLDRWCTPNMSVVYPCSGVCHCVAVWQRYRTLEMKYLVQLVANSTCLKQLFESNSLRVVINQIGAQECAQLETVRSKQKLKVKTLIKW